MFKSNIYRIKVVYVEKLSQGMICVEVQLQVRAGSVQRINPTRKWRITLIRRYQAERGTLFRFKADGPQNFHMHITRSP